MSKGPDAFRTISEVAEELDLPQHVLRFWETRFSQIRPMKRGGGRRYYRPDDVDLLRGIRKLLYGEGYTIKGVQRILKEQGARQVVLAGQGGALDPAPPGHRFEPEFEGDVPEGILVDEGREARGAAPYVDPGAGQRREPLFGGRREPVLTDRPSPSFGRSDLHASPQRSEPDFTTAPASRIPAAPPDEPDEAEVYLPPQAVHPAPPPPPSPTYEKPAAARNHAFEGPAIRSFAPPTEDDDGLPSGHPTSPPSLSGDDIDRLQAALVELLECKRILDHAR
ncbi:MerR HTH family regulatory protein [Kaistia soli DSM 19436]|uniref:MerR HTH family regulatory protein n=1 Tax=Kaistia soli DSM 19436 TaxID=1122133 RepID=A0A1M5K8Q6_9HYPH|nr:MerR family transcriptional regulator [Kaistia soli]SHG48970.1 MerR HTH family regulatory protein [Kaistia soli DSM 19436]